MIKKYNNISLAVGAPGIILQIVGFVMSSGESQGASPLILLGTIMLMVGLGYYAAAKGRSPLWCLAGCAGILGLILLALLKDLDEQKTADDHVSSLETELAEKQKLIDEMKSGDS